MGIDGKPKKRASLAELRNRRQAELRKVQSTVLASAIIIIIIGLCLGGFYYVKTQNINISQQFAEMFQRLKFPSPPSKTNTDTGEGDSAIEPSDVTEPLDEATTDRYQTEDESSLPEAAETIRLAFVGDIYFTPNLVNRIKAQPTFNPFAYSLTPLNNADLVAINLESPLTNETTRNSIKTKEQLESKEAFAHKAPPEMASVLSKGNVRIASLANNHILDYNAKGLEDTITALDDAGINHIGAGSTKDEASQIRVLDVGGLNVAFLGLSEIVPYGYAANSEKPGVWSTNNASSSEKYEEVFGEKILEAKSKADIVIVILHWGNERKTEPNTNQVSLGKWLIKKGVNLVIGQHPHVVQGLEFIDTGLVAYSLGNFIWNPGSKETASTGVLVVELKNKEVTKAEFYPGIIKDSIPRVQDMPFTFTPETKGYIDLNKIKPSAKLGEPSVNTDINIGEVKAPEISSKTISKSSSKTSKTKTVVKTLKPKTDVVIKSEKPTKTQESTSSSVNSKRKFPSDFMPIQEEPVKTKTKTITKAKSAKTKVVEKEKEKPKPKPEEKPKPKLPLPPGS